MQVLNVYAKININRQKRKDKEREIPCFTT
nr:MAG TPA: hypothetical protein [Caudoviricetes sp.]